MKDYNAWSGEKKRIDTETKPKFYDERELWWCSLGLNVGYEQNGTGAGYQRPVLVLRGVSRETCYIVPLTASLKKHKYRIPIGIVGGKDATALISQMRLIDTKRLVNKIGYLEKGIFADVRKAAKDML